MRRLMILALPLVALPAAPARAADSFRLHAGPVSVRGYAMTLDVATFKRTATLDVTFTRKTADATQSHDYAFIRRVRLTAPRGLRTGRLRADLGALGRVDLRFRRTGAIHRTKQLPSCAGPKPRRRLGRLSGTFRLVADSTFFGTVRAHRLRGALTRVPSGVRCTGAIPFENPPGTLTLDAGDQRAALEVEQVAGGRSLQTLTVTTSRPAVTHTLVALGPAGSFSGTRDAATVTGAAPAFTGSLGYTATSHVFGPVPSTEGTTSGDLTGEFDSIGARRVPLTDDASITGPG
jgi:hypothetical protein